MTREQLQDYLITEGYIQEMVVESGVLGNMVAKMLAIGAAETIIRLLEAFKNLDDREWDVVSEGLADPESADTMLLRLLGTRGRLNEEDNDDRSD